MKRNIIAAIIAMTAAATAGTKASYEVTMFGSSATGSPASVRASADNVQYIGCNKYAVNGWGSTVTCTARSADGMTLTCYNRTQAEMKDTVSAITNSSFIEFHFDANEPTKCGFIKVDTSSKYGPLQP